MIHVFNYPIEPSSLDEFHGERRSSDPGVGAIFDPNAKRRKDVKYLADGRKEIDGALQEEDKQNSNDLWRTTLTRGVAHEWKDKANGGRIQRAKKYLSEMSYEVRVYFSQHQSHGTALLVVLNALLFAGLLYMLKMF